MTNSRTTRLLLPPSQKELSSVLQVAIAYWRIIALAAALGGIVGVAVALIMRPVYRADARIIPVSENVLANRALSSGIVDLAALAGVNIGSEGTTQENIAYLQSDALLVGYVNEHNALSQVFDDEWDAAMQRWRESAADHLPTIGKALKKLHEGVFFVSVDRKTGVITVSMRHHQPAIAAQWVNGLVTDANRNLRERDMNESAVAIAFLRHEAENATQPVELKEALYRLIEEQMKKRAVAAAREEYAFRVIDRARVPESWEKVAPVRRVIVGISVIIGAVLGLGLALLLSQLPTPSNVPTAVG